MIISRGGSNVVHARFEWRLFEATQEFGVLEVDRGRLLARV